MYGGKDIMTISLQIYYSESVRNFENRSTFGDVMGPFLTNTHCVHCVSKTRHSDTWLFDHLKCVTIRLRETWKL